MIFMHIRPGEYMGVHFGVNVEFKNHIFQTEDQKLIEWMQKRVTFNVDFGECDEDGNPPACIGGRGFLQNRPETTVDLYKISRRKDEILKNEKAQAPRSELALQRQPPNPEQIRRSLETMKADADKAVVEKAFRSEKWPAGYSGNEKTNSPFETKKQAMIAIKEIEKRARDGMIRYPSKWPTGGWLIRTEDPNNASNNDKRKSKG